MYPASVHGVTFATLVPMSPPFPTQALGKPLGGKAPCAISTLLNQPWNSQVSIMPGSVSLRPILTGRSHPNRSILVQACPYSPNVSSTRWPTESTSISMNLFPSMIQQQKRTQTGRRPLRDSNYSQRWAWFNLKYMFLQWANWPTWQSWLPRNPRTWPICVLTSAPSWKPARNTLVTGGGCMIFSTDSRPQLPETRTGQWWTHPSLAGASQAMQRRYKAVPIALQWNTTHRTARDTKGNDRQIQKAAHRIPRGWSQMCATISITNNLATHCHAPGSMHASAVNQMTTPCWIVQNDPRKRRKRNYNLSVVTFIIYPFAVTFIIYMYAFAVNSLVLLWWLIIIHNIIVRIDYYYACIIISLNRTLPHWMPLLYLQIYSQLEVSRQETHPFHLGTARSPLHLPAWSAALRSHSDTYFVGYILEGIQNGFHVGRDQPITSAHINLPEHLEIISECSKGCWVQSQRAQYRIIRFD